jgi:hypothetical protein
MDYRYHHPFFKLIYYTDSIYKMYKDNLFIVKHNVLSVDTTVVLI